MRIRREFKIAHLTGPSSSSLVFVTESRGVDAKTHTPPLLSLIAVERPPTGNSPNRAKGLKLKHYIIMRLYSFS